MKDYAGNDDRYLDLSGSSHVFLFIWLICHFFVDCLPFLLLRYDRFQKNKTFVKTIAVASMAQKFFQCISFVAFNPETSWLSTIATLALILIISIGNLRLTELYSEKSHPFIALKIKTVQKVIILCFGLCNTLILVRIGWLGIKGPSFLYEYEEVGILIFVGIFFVMSIIIYVFITQNLFKLIIKANGIRKRTLINKESIRRFFLASMGISIFLISLSGILIFLVKSAPVSPQILALVANTTTWNANLLVMAMFLLERLSIPVSQTSAIELIKKANLISPSVIEEEAVVKEDDES
jgi:hypothetical protein